jgi:hypothetical protein
MLLKINKAMMAHRSFSMHQLIWTGICILILSTLSLIMFYEFFNDSVNNTKNYLPDQCIITSIELKNTDYNCWDLVSGLVTVVNLPCTKILANSIKKLNLTFYRNIEEKLNAINNQADVN